VLLGNLLASGVPDPFGVQQHPVEVEDHGRDYHRTTTTMWSMSDESIAARIERLVAEEHDLRRREQADSTRSDDLDSDRERLRDVEVELDRCWDLLRQRRAREEFGQNPDEAQVRDADTVERYWQ
jgi:hypothetical protein